MSRAMMMEEAERRANETLAVLVREDVLKFVARTFLSAISKRNTTRAPFLLIIECTPKSTLVDRFLNQEDKPYGGKDRLRRDVDELCNWIYENGDTPLLHAVLLYKYYNSNYRDAIAELVYTMEVDSVIAKRGEPVQYNSLCRDYHSIVYLCEDWVEGETGTLSVSDYSNLTIKGHSFAPVELLHPVTITQN